MRADLARLVADPWWPVGFSLLAGCSVLVTEYNPTPGSLISDGLNMVQQVCLCRRTYGVSLRGLIQCARLLVPADSWRLHFH